MGHSQSYDLRNPENSTDCVRGVRRISKEHESNSTFYLKGTHDYREDELRERIRKEELKKRERELNSLRISENDSREPIIDAYRENKSPSLANFSEFNYYDHLKQPSPIHPDTFYTLIRHREINNGEQQEFKSSGKNPPKKQVSDYPAPHIFTGRLSPLSRHRELENCPLPRLIPPMSSVPRYEMVSDEGNTETSQIFAEKRMIVSMPNEELKWSSCSTNLAHPSDEDISRALEIDHQSVLTRPTQSSYEENYKEGCSVPYCTHVEVPDKPADILRVVRNEENEKENRLKIIVDNGKIGKTEKPTLPDYAIFKIPSEEKLHYQPYFPTISLERRPNVGFYDKLP